MWVTIEETESKDDNSNLPLYYFLQGTVQISMAEFNPEDSTLKWYNVLSSKFIPSFESLDMPSTSAAAAAAAVAASNNCNIREESSDESTITSSQTSTLTRNQAPPLELQAQIAEELPEHVRLNEQQCSDEDDDDDEEEDEQQLVSTIGLNHCE